MGFILIELYDLKRDKLNFLYDSKLKVILLFNMAIKLKSQHFANAVMPEKCFLFGLNGNIKIYNNITKGSLYWQLNKVQTWKGFSPVWTNWCLFSLELSTNAFPHSAQTWTRGPCVCRCFLMAELSRNILLQPCQVKHTYRYILLLLSHSLKEYWRIRPYCRFFKSQRTELYLPCEDRELFWEHHRLACGA